jgi:hypothetical protein
MKGASTKLVLSQDWIATTCVVRKTSLTEINDTSDCQVTLFLQLEIISNRLLEGLVGSSIAHKLRAPIRSVVESALHIGDRHLAHAVLRWVSVNRVGSLRVSVHGALGAKL